MKIKDLFQDERPRERLLKNGAGSLSDVELLAVLLRTGNKQLNAMELARSLLEGAEGKIAGLAHKSEYIYKHPKIPLFAVCEHHQYLR